MTMKLLFPLDGSDRGKRAVSTVEKLALALDAEVILLTVVEDAEEAKADADSRLRELAGKFTGSVRYRIECGLPAACILQVIADEAPDIVVMSSHGEQGFSELPMGAVVRDVIKASKVPVTVVGPSVELAL